MPSSKKPEKSASTPTPLTEAQKAARLKEIEDSIKAIDPKKRIMPSTPEEAKALDELVEKMEEEERRFHRDFKGLKLPPKKNEPHSR